jgi:23S rRNA pseudouridine2605 synthase
MPAERISKVLAAAGIASRRGADALVAGGHVTIDGHAAVLGERVDPGVQVIAVDGRAVTSERSRPVYVALHKPAEVVSTVRDRHAAVTVVDLVPSELVAGARIYPVGRLDRDSEGLILLTSDGAWADRVLHPRYEVEREYAVGLTAPLTRAQADRLQAGVALAEGIAVINLLRPQTRTEDRRLADILDPSPDPRLVWVRATIHQGWKRQLRRMFADVGAPVRRLVRVRIGGVRLDSLESGGARRLTAAEIRRLAGPRSGGAAIARDPRPHGARIARDPGSGAR